MRHRIRIKRRRFYDFLMQLGRRCLSMAGLEKLQRRYPRRRVRFIIRYSDAELGDTDFSQVGVANLYNISEGGLQFHSNQPAVVHSLLNIDIQLSWGGIVIPVVGETVWTQQVHTEKSFYYKVGVMFREIDEKYRDLIRVICADKHLDAHAA